MTRLALIAAYAHDRVIGRANTLPWRLPEDLRHFKALTSGHPVIMGRKTWESLGRPLPGRHNIVITRQSAYAASGASIVGSLTAALTLVAGDDCAFIIGGADIYRQSLPLADRLYLTEIDLDVIDGDARFPAIAAADWREVSRRPGVGDNGLAYTFLQLDRQTPAVQATQST